MADIFISYTHKDNAKLSDESQGWIDRFHEALQERLNQLWGRETRFWRDPDIEGNDLLRPTIESAIGETALLVSVVSPGYLNSAWCQDEVRMFCNAAGKSGGLRVGNKTRVVKVIKTPVPSQAVGALAEIADAVGYPFFRIADGGVPHEFDPRLGAEARQEFLNRVNEVAYCLCGTLEALAGSEWSRREVRKPTGVSIFLAEGSFDVAGERERLRAELEQFGHTVLPRSHIDYTPHYVDAVRADLAQCRLAIHPVGKGYGVVPDGFETSVVELQYGAAGEEAARRAEFVRLPWMPRGVEVSDARQLRFVQALQDDPRFMVASLEELKSAAQDALAPPPAPVPRAAQPTPLAGGLVYLICDLVDAEAVQPVEDVLFEGGFDVVRPLADGDETEMRRDHEENLHACDAVLIYHGRTSDFWLRSKLRDLQRTYGADPPRSRPFRARGVLLGDPATPEKARFRNHDLLVLPLFGQPAQPVLTPFLRLLGAAEDAAV